MSYAGAAYTGPREGRQASPSNPTKGKKGRKPDERSEVVVFRCSAAEKQALIEKENGAGLPFAALLREALGLAKASRRRPLPRVDPDLIRAVGRIGGNINQIARSLNGAVGAGQLQAVEAAVIAAQLVAVERSLRALVVAASHSLSHLEAADAD